MPANLDQVGLRPAANRYARTGSSVGLPSRVSSRRTASSAPNQALWSTRSVGLLLVSASERASPAMLVNVRLAAIPSAKARADFSQAPITRRSTIRGIGTMGESPAPISARRRSENARARASSPAPYTTSSATGGLYPRRGE